MSTDTETEQPRGAARRYEPTPSSFLASRPYYPWLVVGTTCIAAFAGQVDASIVQLALPTLERAFDARLSAVSWVAIAYVLSFAAILPVFARLAEMAGRKLMYLVGFTMFGLQGLWQESMDTLALTLSALFVSLLLGIPLLRRRQQNLRQNRLIYLQCACQCGRIQARRHYSRRQDV